MKTDPHTNKPTSIEPVEWIRRMDQVQDPLTTQADRPKLMNQGPPSKVKVTLEM